MQQTWRWFGPNDPVTLEKIIQAGASGVVTSLHHIPTGEPWPLAQVLERKAEIEAHGLASRRAPAGTTTAGQWRIASAAGLVRTL